MVPLALRARVWSAWRKRQRAPDDDAVVGVHTQVCAAALAAVHQRLQEATT